MNSTLPALSVCPDALAIAAEHIVKRIAQPGDDLAELRLAARAFLLSEVEKELS